MSEAESPCPICERLIPASVISFHIESCLEAMEMKEQIKQIEADEAIAIEYAKKEEPKKKVETTKPVDIPVVNPMDYEEAMCPCPVCGDEFPVEQIEKHCSSCLSENEYTKKKTIPSPPKPKETNVENNEPKESCPFCAKQFSVKNMVSHVRKCRTSICTICNEEVPEYELTDHMSTCEDPESKRKRLRQLDEDEKLAMQMTRESLDGLTKEQKQAVLHVQAQSKIDSEKAYPALLERFKKMGFTEENLKQTLQYIRNEAPIIIHINLDKILHLIVKDTHYRNQFETKTSGGYLHEPSRTQWEDRLFNNLYHKVKPFDRVKYGVLNIVNDPDGVKCCSSYGDSYLLLQNVRLRTTFASKDTSNADVKLSCPEHYCHVLLEYAEQELQDVISIACGFQRCVDSKSISVYKEVQIHGPIVLSRDVEALVVNKRFKGNKKIEDLIYEFVEKNFCNVIWME